jgi:membrane associated rhomboid family serine protease/tetratricopeptide (TPR) repeat protein
LIPTGTNLQQKKIPQATLYLIVSNFAIFFLQSLLLNQSSEIPLFLSFGSGNIGLIGLFTSMFLHHDFLHITFNMLYLWVFGPPLEDRIGKKLLLKYYLIGGVAASLFELIVSYLQNPLDTYCSIGASGSVSAIMAIYLYRCYFSKLKMSVTLYLPFSISLPAAPLLILWFCLNVYSGCLAFTTPSNIGHWAHIGGFLFGLAVGRFKKYGHEGTVERYSDKVLKEITEKGGWKDAESEKELLKLLDLNPQDPDMHLQLGRYYHEHDRDDEAAVSYRNAIQKFFPINPLFASYVLLEYGETFGKAISPHYHLKAGDALSMNGDAEDAYKVIKPVVQAVDQGQINERIQVLIIKLCKALSKEEELAHSLRWFSKTYPASRYRKELTEALGKNPEELFLSKKPLPATPEPIKEAVVVGQEAGPREIFTLKAFHKLMNIVVDPLFLFVWLTLETVVTTILLDRSIGPGLELTLFFISFVFVAFLRASWSDSGRDVEVNEVTKRLEMDAAAAYDSAVNAERRKDYLTAVEFYEKVLFYDPLKLQARCNLANVYLDQLNDHVNGKKHLELLMKTAPKYHQFYRHAVEKLTFLHQSPFR